MDSTRLSWPSLDEGYTDEFGVICPEVYRAAGELWPQAEGFVHSKLRDCPAGMQLMLKAAATVSRKRREQPDQIRDLKAYLWTTFKHFISDEVEKGNRYQPLEHEQQPENDARGPSEALDDQILIEEVMAQMDSWTRRVFELRVLGYQFEDIAHMLNTSPHLLRSKFHKEIKKLSRRLRG
jgi:DNA-directed RNA polymerase specialized sigma24 family protein